MEELVMFRDLPGGARKVKFADGISTSFLCGKCGMLSLIMYTDYRSHMFCEACLLAQIYQHGNDHIRCQYDGKDIPINQLEKPFAVLASLGDQYVDCPNREKCGKQVHLRDLKAHYVACQPEVTWSTCGNDVRSSDWDGHTSSCGGKGGQGEKSKLPMHEETCESNSQIKNKVAQRNQPENSQALPLTKATEPTATDSLTTCPFCERKVRRSNLMRHEAVCVKSSASCAYCGKNVKKGTITMHEENCESNPQSKNKVQRKQPENSQTPPLMHGDSCQSNHEKKDKVQKNQQEHYQTLAAVHSAQSVKPTAHAPKQMNSEEERRKLPAPKPLSSPLKTSAKKSSQENVAKPINLGERTTRVVRRELNIVVVRQPLMEERKKETRAPGISLDERPSWNRSSIQDPYSAYQRGSDSFIQNTGQNIDKGADDDCEKCCKMCCLVCCCPFVCAGWLIYETLACLLCCK
uniref:Putative tnf receptor-associated factor 6 n=1 Tax=Amblyomma sculptum TaxID=1581419 RepID=A0A1E1XPX2_AMBSC